MNTLRICLISLVWMGNALLGASPETPKNYELFVPQASEVLGAHNFVRGKVGVPPLSWSNSLARAAQDWANTLMARGTFMHSADLPYGENLFEIMGEGATSTAFEVVNAWGAESEAYRYDTNACRGECGHFTQVVWRDTKQVGCGVARDRRREIWVCEYAPFGNVIGQRPY